MTLAVPALSAGLGAASYLMVLSEYYSWWVVVLVAPLTLLGAVVCVALIWFSNTGSLLVRAVWFAIGSGCVYTGLTEAGRLGTLLMGVALVLVCVLPGHSSEDGEVRSQGSPEKPSEGRSLADHTGESRSAIQ